MRIASGFSVKKNCNWIRSLPFHLRFRLGSLEYVNWLEQEAKCNKTVHNYRIFHRLHRKAQIFILCKSVQSVVKKWNYSETDCSFNTFFITPTIFSPFSFICSSRPQQTDGSRNTTAHHGIAGSKIFCWHDASLCAFRFGMQVHLR